MAPVARSVSETTITLAPPDTCCGGGQSCAGLCIRGPFGIGVCVGGCRPAPGGPGLPPPGPGACPPGFEICPSTGTCMPPGFCPTIGPGPPPPPGPQPPPPPPPRPPAPPRNGACPSRAAAARILCAPGCHPNKASYFLKDGTFVEAGTRCVTNRRRNPLNPRALDRAAGRLRSAQKAVRFLQAAKIPKRRRR